jgi:hypothetical protein
MTAFYDSLINATNKLIADKGQTVTFRQVTEGTYNATTSSATNTETNYTVKAVLLPYNAQAVSSDALIQQGDMKLLVSPKQTAGGAMVTASPQDKVTVNGELWVIVNVKPLYPNGQLVFQEWQIRK